MYDGHHCFVRNEWTFYPGPIGVPPFSPNAPCNRSHFFFLGPALDSEIRCFHHTSLPPTVQLLSNILVSTEFPPSPRAQNHRSTSFVGKIWIDCDCDSTEFDRVARNENCGGNEKSENRIVDRFNPMDIRRDWKKEQGTSQNFFTGLFLSTRNSCQQRCGATTLRMGEKTPVK